MADFSDFTGLDQSSVRPPPQQHFSQSQVPAFTSPGDAGHMSRAVNPSAPHVNQIQSNPPGQTHRTINPLEQAAPPTDFNQPDSDMSFDDSNSNHLSSAQPVQQHELPETSNNETTVQEPITEEDEDYSEEEFIELASEGPQADRLDNSKLIKDLKIGKKRRKELLEYDDRQRMLRLVDEFSDEQVNRYEMYRRSCFPRNHIKRLMQATANCAVAQQVCIAMSGIAKVYVGEIVEEALRVAS